MSSFKSRRKLIFPKFLSLSLLVISLAVTVIFLSQRQTIGKNAAYGNLVVSVQPTSKTVPVQTGFPVQIWLSTPSSAEMRVSAYDLSFEFDQGVLQIKDFSPNLSTFPRTSVVDYGGATGLARFSANAGGMQDSELAVVSSAKAAMIGTVTLVGKKAGISSLGVIREKSLIVGLNKSPVPGDAAFVISEVRNGSYTIIPKPTSLTATPTARPTPVIGGPTPTAVPQLCSPKGTVCTIPSQCCSKICTYSIRGTLRKFCQ